MPEKAVADERTAKLFMLVMSRVESDQFYMPSDSFSSRFVNVRQDPWSANG